MNPIVCSACTVRTLLYAVSVMFAVPVLYGPYCMQLLYCMGPTVCSSCTVWALLYAVSVLYAVYCTVWALLYAVCTVCSLLYCMGPTVCSVCTVCSLLYCMGPTVCSFCTVCSLLYAVSAPYVASTVSTPVSFPGPGSSLVSLSGPRAASLLGPRAASLLGPRAVAGWDGVVLWSLEEQVYSCQLGGDIKRSYVSYYRLLLSTLIWATQLLILLLVPSSSSSLLLSVELSVISPPLLGLDPPVDSPSLGLDPPVGAISLGLDPPVDPLGLETGIWAFSVGLLAGDAWQCRGLHWSSTKAAEVRVWHHQYTTLWLQISAANEYQHTRTNTIPLNIIAVWNPAACWPMADWSAEASSQCSHRSPFLCGVPSQLWLVWAGSEEVMRFVSDQTRVYIQFSLIQRQH